jgi:hypothetical protein
MFKVVLKYSAICATFLLICSARKGQDYSGLAYLLITSSTPEKMSLQFHAELR